MNITEDMRTSATIIAENELANQGAEFDLVPKHIQMALMVEAILELDFWEKDEELSDEDCNEIARCYEEMVEGRVWQETALAELDRRKEEYRNMG